MKEVTVDEGREHRRIKGFYTRDLHYSCILLNQKKLRENELRHNCGKTEWILTSSLHTLVRCIGSTVIETCQRFVCCHLSYQVQVPPNSYRHGKRIPYEAVLTQALVLPHLDLLNTLFPQVSWRRMGHRG